MAAFDCILHTFYETLMKYNFYFSKLRYKKWILGLTLFLHESLCAYRKNGHITAILDQSEGKEIKQIITMPAILTHWGYFSWLQIQIKTTAHARDHISLQSSKRFWHLIHSFNPLSCNRQLHSHIFLQAAVDKFSRSVCRLHLLVSAETRKMPYFKGSRAYHP